MDRTHRPGRLLLSLLLCLALLCPLPVSAADLYFTAINDNVLPLTADTMPLWSGGVLYVPYTVFDGRYTKQDLGLTSNYSRENNTVSIYNLRQILSFDMTNGYCRDEMTGDTYSSRAIMRNGKPYVPLKMVCNFFGLEWSYSTISQGYLVRIKSDSVVLSDPDFIDAAGTLINRRLRDYNQSLNPTPEPSTPTPVTPAVIPEENTSPSDVRTYLAFRCQSEEGISAILDALDSNQVRAVFFLSPQVLEFQSDLVRRILGTGHSVGLLAEGESLEQTQELLAQGSRLLEQTVHARSTLAYVPKDQRTALSGDGWVCWQETTALTPTASVGPNTFASNAIRKLSGRSRTTYLTMPGSSDTGRVLNSLLRQLKSNHFVVSIPMETRL